MSTTTIRLAAGELAEALAKVARVVERKNTIPILSNVALRPEPGGLRLVSTNLDIEMSARVAAAIDGDREPTTVPGILAADILKKWKKGDQVELFWDREAARLKCGRSRFALQTLPFADFPDLSVGEMSHRFTVSGEALSSMIERSQFAISNEETRYYLNGVYLHVMQDRGRDMLRAVATDGHRLAQIQIEAPDGAAGMPGIIVPRFTIAAIDRLIGKGDVLVELSTTKIRFTIGDVVVTSKLIDGTFPDYTRVIPTENNKKAVVRRDEFEAAVDRVSTIASDRGRAVKLSFSTGRLDLDITCPDQGTAHEEMDANFEGAEPGDALEIGFNSKYLLDIFGVIEGDIAMHLADPGSPALIRDEANADAIFVLMPMRI